MSLTNDTDTLEHLESEMPKILTQMNEDEREEFYLMVERKAWVLASQVETFSDQEQSIIAKAEKDKGPRFRRTVENRLYNRHHWRSLRWFLFGGLVDIPIASDPTRAYDPETNPWVKIKVPGFAVTTDEHDQANPYKRLPDKQYLRLAAYAWVHEPLLALPKSRQMMVTWVFCSIAVHETAFRAAKRTAVISKKFDDSNAHIEKRIKSVWDKLPSDRLWVPNRRFKSGELTCDWSGSSIMAMGEEAKGLRQYTFSWIFFDEAAFAEQTDEIITASLPTVKGGGRLSLVSTPNGRETFYNVCSEGGKLALPAGP